MATHPEIKPLQTAHPIHSMKRRELIKLAPILALGAIAFPKLHEPLIRNGLGLSDYVAERLRWRGRLAETFADRQVTPLEKFPFNSYNGDPEIDLESWTLTVEGAVARPGEYTLDQIRELPKYVQNVRHICIEGWNVVGNFGGARLSDFLRFVGYDPGANFVEVTCWDDYSSSYDMESCLHPQTLLCYEMYGRPLEPGHGAPLRIHMPTKLGYKSSKYLASLKVSPKLGISRGFWEDQGYSWYGGL
jgi:DMSO/TMAO reductase YedYZ molybdopterin-dependent catalytic subunit